MEVNAAAYPQDIVTLIRSSSEVNLAVAFVTQSGLQHIKVAVAEGIDQKVRVRIILDLSDGATDPSAIWELLALAESSHNQVELKAYVADRPGFLHAKLYLGIKDTTAIAISGSANLTEAALLHNIEHGFRLVGTTTDVPLSQAIVFFEQLWISPHSKVIDKEAARLYELYHGRKSASQTRADRRSRSALRALINYFSSLGSIGFSWPSVDSAFMMGAITARGAFLPNLKQIDIRLRFRSTFYGQGGSGQIILGSKSFNAAEVLPEIPQNIAQQARLVFPKAKVILQGFRIVIDFSSDHETFDAVIGLFQPWLTCDEFRLPKDLDTASEPIFTEFVRGFAVASALLTDHTSLPGNKRLGLPGQHVVWLRPKQKNTALFELLRGLIDLRLGLRVYTHRRTDREPHLKIPCEDFRGIGFGIPWWDDLLDEGAALNTAHYPS
jgi:HKD family nuclease